MYVGRPFCGSANIVRANQQRRRIAMVWMTALLLALPRVALPCGCHFASQNDQALTACEPEQHCQHGCCHAPSRTKFRAVCTIVRSAPVELISSSTSHHCPPHCPCRLQHAPQQIGLVRSTLADEEAASAADVAVVIPPTQLQTPDRFCNSLPLTTCLSAPERCSLLCRFTI